MAELPQDLPRNAPTPGSATGLGGAYAAPSASTRLTVSFLKQAIVSGRLYSPSLPGFPRLGLVPDVLQLMDLIPFLLPSLMSPASAPVPPTSVSVFSSVRGAGFCSCGVMRLGEVPPQPSLINGGRPSATTSVFDPPQVPGAVPKLTQVRVRMRPSVRPAAPPVNVPAFLAPPQRTALVRAGGSLAGTLWGFPGVGQDAGLTSWPCRGGCRG